MKRTIAAISAVFGLLLTLAGCNSDPEPIEPKNSASTSATPPALPEGARASDARGALTFVAFWIELVNYATSTGNAEPMLSYTQDCDSCRALGTDMAAVLVDGARPPDRIWNIATITPRSNAAAVVDVAIRAKPDYGVEELLLGIHLTDDPPYLVKQIWRIRQ